MKKNKDGFQPGEFMTAEQQNDLRVKKMQEKRHVSAGQNKKAAVRTEDSAAEKEAGGE